MSNDELYFTFDLGENDSINANFDLEENNNLDANFNIYAAGTTWGSISGNIINQPDLYSNLTGLQSQITVNSDAITGINSTLATYGDIVTHNVSDFATAAQGALADTALQPGANISRLTNNVGYITASALNGYATQLWVTDRGYITGINSDDVVTALGYTPYNATNPSGYITSADLPTIEDLTTTAQLAAINSGATALKIEQIATNEQNISNLQTTVTNNYNTLDNRITSETSTLNTAIGAETTNRQNADNNLQSQIDALIVSSDVFDIVGTYAELETYDISTVPINDIIKVLIDSTHNNAATYYRCIENNGVKTWSYIGAEGAYYTKSESDNRFVAKTTTINGKALDNNITLTASDVGALPSTTFIPTDTSDLTNGAGFITSAALTNYVTTDTAQHISGRKTFTNGITTSDINCNNSTFTVTVSNKMLMSCSSNNIDIGNGDRIITFLPPSGQTRPYWGSPNKTLALSSDIPSTANFVTNSSLATTLSDYATLNWVGQQGYLTASALNGYATQTWVTNQGYLTSVSSSDVTTALGYTPVNKAGDIMTGTLNFNSSNHAIEVHNPNYLNGYGTFTSNTSGGTLFWGNCENNGTWKQGILIIQEDNTATLSIAPAASADTTSKQLATTGWVNNPALSTNVVHRTDAETIAGRKTFTDIPTVEKANYPRFCLRTTDWTRGTNPSSSSNAGMIIQDSNNDMGNSHRLGEFVTQLSTNGSVYSEMRTYKNVVENTSAYIRVGFNTAGESYAECPNPKESSNTNNIATTKWVKDFAATSGSNYMSTFSKGAAGYYKFTNGLIIQWGQRNAISKDGESAITFPTAFSNTNYSLTDCAIRQSANNDVRSCATIKTGSKTTTGLTLIQDTFADEGGQWIAIGY